MKTKINWLVIITIGGFIIFGCTSRSKYDRLLKHEIASGIRCDSLFMGFYLGMPEKEFYLHCWNLNKAGKIMQGESNTTVQYELKNELQHDAIMEFYPKFNQGKISEMPVRFKYSGWAPWNKELSSDKLEEDILRWYKNTYGDEFIEVRHPDRGTAWVKINGNRQITIYKDKDLYAWAIFIDLLVKKNWNDSPVNRPDNPVDTLKRIDSEK